jgi:hypothetical protein
MHQRAFRRVMLACLESGKLFLNEPLPSGGRWIFILPQVAMVTQIGLLRFGRGFRQSVLNRVDNLSDLSRYMSVILRGECCFKCGILSEPELVWLLM